MSPDIPRDRKTSKLIPMRSLLFVPGNRESMLEKATGARPDAFVPDLEDSVPPDEKLNARVSVERALPTFAKTGIPVIPRLNGVDSEWLEDDIEATVGPHVYGVSIGKVRTPADIRHIDELLLRAERVANVDEGRIRLVPWIETARAVLECFQICTASSRIVAIAFGAEDLTLDMGIRRSTDDSEVSVPRSLTCLAAAAAGLPALDTPFFAFRDPEALERNSEASKKVGFRGKFAIHPAQIDTINGVFSPSQDEITEARRIVEAFDSAAQKGRGSTSLDGLVVDVPVAERARALLQRAGVQTD
jgi:citrate lyase subunit beta/citryl-CoA lyase